MEYYSLSILNGNNYLKFIIIIIIIIFITLNSSLTLPYICKY